MNKSFDEIAKIQNLIAAAFLNTDEKITGWCANNHFSEETLRYIGANCLAILEATNAEKQTVHTGSAAFGDTTLVFRKTPDGLFLAYLSTPVNDAILNWLLEQVGPLLERDGIRIGVDT